MITVTICDSDIRIRKELTELCKKYFYKNKVEIHLRQCASGEEVLMSEPADILIIGIQMKKISGILVKEILGKMDVSTRIVFVAEDKKQMTEAFGKQVYGYLTLPMKEQKFYRLLDDMMSDIRQKTQYVYCKKENEIKKVRFKDLLYVEKQGRSTLAYVKEENPLICPYVSELPLVRWEELLPAERFIRVNKSQIVNLNYVVDINCVLVLKNEIKIKVGKNYKKKVWESVNEFKSGRTIVC